jgi:hypothetical protein
VFLTFNGLLGQCCPIQCATPSSEWENTVPQWALKLNSAVASAEKWLLGVCLLRFKGYNFCTNLIEQSPLSEASSSLVSHDILHISTFCYQQIEKFYLSTYTGDYSNTLWLLLIAVFREH